MVLTRLSPICLLFAGFLLANLGCSPPSEPALYPARAVLLYRNQPLSGAEVVLHPEAPEPSWMPVARTDETGAFSAGSKIPGDGAPAGRYRLAVVWRPQLDADGEGPNVLPPRYADAKTSALELIVAPDASEIPTFELRD